MKTSEMQHPRQPIGLDDDQVIRFKENKIINWMLDMGQTGQKFDMNTIVIKRHIGEFSNEDLVQLYQLIGYSVSGFGDLHHIPEEEVIECDEIAASLFRDKK